MDFDRRSVVAERAISSIGLERYFRAIVPASSVSVVCIASIGKVCMTDRRTLTNQQINTLVCDTTKIDPRFAYYSLRLKRGELIAKASGVATPILNKTAFEKIEIALPPLDIQHRIVGVLSAFDDLIEVNTRRIAILEEMAHRFFGEWFVNFRIPGSIPLEYIETALGLIPKGWAIVPLENYCQRITDGAHRSPTTAEGGRLMASVKDMRDWGFDLTQCRYISEDEFQNLVRNDCKPKRGDILIAKDGANLNKHTFLMRDEPNVVLLSSIAILRPKPEVPKEFLLGLLRSKEVSDRIKRSVSGAAIPRIILKDFKRLPVVMPPPELQAAWSDLAGPMHELCWQLSKTNLSLRAARDLLLPHLISGKINFESAAYRSKAIISRAAAE